MSLLFDKIYRSWIITERTLSRNVNYSSLEELPKTESNRTFFDYEKLMFHY